MSANEVEKRQARRQAVDDAYGQLEKHHVDRKRLVFLPNKHKRSGGYGIVKPAQLHPSSYLPAWYTTRQSGPPQLVAVKQIRTSALDDPSDLKTAFIKELLVWSGLGEHPGISKFIGFYANWDRHEAWLLSPWEENGNISDFISEHELEVPEKFSLVHDIIDALAFLHQLDPPVCHGDIKSTNVLVNRECRAVLCDFGLARIYEDSGFERLETSTGFKGSVRWCSPELISGEKRSPSSDVYAWAWLVWEIMTGELPYGGTSALYAIILKIFEGPSPHANGEFRLADCLQVWELMTKCWANEPKIRLTSKMCETVVASLPRCTPSSKYVGSPLRSAAALENMGDLQAWRGNFEDSYSFMDQALKTYEQDSDLKGTAIVLLKQAQLLYRYFRYPASLTTATTALKHLRDLGDRPRSAQALFCMGCCLLVLTKEDDALPVFEEATAIYRECGNDAALVQCLERKGEIQNRQLQYEAAVSTLEEASSIAVRCGYSLGQAKALFGLGISHWRQGDDEAANSALRRAAAIARQIEWRTGLSFILGNLASVWSFLREGDEEAEKLYAESIWFARSVSAPLNLATGLYNLGHFHWQRGRFDEVAKVAAEAHSIYRELSVVNSCSADAASLLADAKSKLNDPEGAVVLYEEAITTFRQLGKNEKLANTLGSKTMYLLSPRKMYDEAALHIEAGMVICRETDGLKRGVAEARQLLSKFPMTAMGWEWRTLRMPTLPRNCSILPKTPLFYNHHTFQQRIPQLITPNLKFGLRPGNGGVAERSHV